MDILQKEYDEYTKMIQSMSLEGDLQHLVFGEGEQSASIVFIGEAPGAQEAKEGRPFIGKAGKQLDELLEEVAIDRSKLFVTNAVKYRPTKNQGRANRTPTGKEIALSRPLLMQELAWLEPALVVTLGNSPLLAMTSDAKNKIGAVHGTLLEEYEYKIFPLYHPASLIYNRELLQTYKEDLNKLARYLEKNHLS